MRIRALVLRTYSSRGAIVKESLSVDDALRRLTDGNHPDTVSELAVRLIELLRGSGAVLSARKIRRLRKAVNNLAKMQENHNDTEQAEEK